MMAKRVVPLAESLGSTITMPCDVGEEGAAAGVIASLGAHWDSLDFVVHALAFADKSALQGDYMDVSRDVFLNSMLISAFSFTEIAHAGAANDDKWRLDADPDLSRCPADHAEL